MLFRSTQTFCTWQTLTFETFDQIREPWTTVKQSTDLYNENNVYSWEVLAILHASSSLYGEYFLELLTLQTRPAFTNSAVRSLCEQNVSKLFRSRREFVTVCQRGEIHDLVS